MVTFKAQSLSKAFKRVQRFSPSWWNVTRVRRIDGLWHITLEVK